MALASFIGGYEFVTTECPGPCSSPPVHQRTANPRMDVSVTPKLVIDAVSTGSPASDRSPSDPVAAAAPRLVINPVIGPVIGPVIATTTTAVEPDPAVTPMEPDPPAEASSETSPEVPPGVEAWSGPQPLAAEPVRCPIAVATEPSLRGPTATALAAINEVATNIVLVVADSGPISISHGGEWPVERPPLGWTAPDRRTVLINPDHPASSIEPALADVIAHELGHVLISTGHVNDGTILDPNIDGRIVIGRLDREFLASLTCSDLGL